MKHVRFHWFVPSRPAGKDREPIATGWLRRLAARLGPTWAASPLRRIVQTACFVSFLGLFFYGCWPYGVQPAPQWRDWAPVDVDAVTGEVTLSANQPPADPIAPDMVLHVVDTAARQPVALGTFRVVRSAGSELTLVPTEAMTTEQLDRLSTSFGPWSLYAKDPSQWPSHFADDLAARQRVPAWLFLALDPLVSLSTALAGRWWIWSLGWAAAILAVCLVIPRGFCGYVCPLGTLIDLFDWAVGRRISQFRLAREGWWTRLKYVLLAAVLVGSLCGVLLAGFVAAIPVITRGMAFLLAPLETGLFRGWHQVPPLHAGYYVSLGLFVGVLALGLLGPRFWCRYVCPTGAIFSLTSLLRLRERQVSSDCAGCGRCATHCPFDAVASDFTTRTADCAFCQTCAGLCPTEAITFGPRGRSPDETPTAKSPTLGRRGFLTAGIGLAAGSLGGASMAALAKTPGLRCPSDGPRPVRAPGSVPEEDFVRICIRCGECLRVCPNDALQPLSLSQGLEGLWTPQVVADWAGCESSCNRCGQVCPTGAIRALPLEEKRVVRMGLATVDQQTCLPYAGRSACQLCADACVGAGYQAIEFVRVGTQLDAAGKPIDDSGFLAPVVRPDKCVGCGQCQTRCYAINVGQEGRLTQSAIRVEAGEGKEDRLRTGSYLALREAEKSRQQKPSPQPSHQDGYLPDFLR
jgi:ferredoxin